jgi:outer membrane protein assembly factor BamB
MLAVAVGAAGCWPAPGAGPDRRSTNPFESAITVESAPRLREAWAATTEQAPVGHPVVSAAGVHVNDPERVYGLDAATGERRWAFRRPPIPVDPPAPFTEITFAAGQPVVDGDRLLVPSLATPYEINLFAGFTTLVLDTATGAQLGTLDGLVDTTRGPRALTRWSSITGELSLGLASLDDPAPPTVPAVVDDAVRFDDPDLHPVTLGTVRTYHAGEGLVTTTPDDTAPVVPAVRAFGARPPGRDFVCKVIPGFPAIFLSCPTWATVLDGAPAGAPVLAEDESTVYVGSDAGRFYALDAATGAVVWSTDVGAPVTAEPAVTAGRIFVPTADGDLVVLRRGNGRVAFTAAAGAPLTVQPAVAGDRRGVVLTGAADGSVHAFPAAGCGAPACAPLWRGDAGAAITGAPAVAGGQVIYGTADGRAVAYRPA